MTTICWLPILLLALLVSTSIQAQDAWELKRNENGIEVYTRKLSDEKFKEIKVVTVLPATPNELVAVVMDIDNQKDWVYGIKKSYVLKRQSEKSVIYYNEVDVPWPATDRDLINHITVTKEAATGKTFIHSKAVPHYIPPKPGLIRIPQAVAHWDITPLDEKQVKIIYTFRVDPGGTLPAWLINSIASMGPYNSFVELRKILEKK